MGLFDLAVTWKEVLNSKPRLIVFQHNILFPNPGVENASVKGPLAEVRVGT